MVPVLLQSLTIAPNFNFARSPLGCEVDVFTIVIYTTKIDELVCPPNTSEPLTVRIIKLAHRPHIASTTFNLTSKSILLSFLSIIFLLKTIQPISAGQKANQSCGDETSPPFFSVILPIPFVSVSLISWCCHRTNQFVLYHFLYLSVYSLCILMAN